MVERLRALLERPLDPGVSRAMLALALAAAVGFAGVVLLAGLGDGTGRRTPITEETPPAGRVPATQGRPARARAVVARQDAQDRPGTEAHRRAVREAAGHRALQHVPYSAGPVSVQLVGAVRGKAILRVEASSIRAARHGWRQFLRRFDDAGTAYVPRFEGGGRRSTPAAEPGGEIGSRGREAAPGATPRATRVAAATLPPGACFPHHGDDPRGPEKLRSPRHLEARS